MEMRRISGECDASTLHLEDNLQDRSLIGRLLAIAFLSFAMTLCSNCSSPAALRRYADLWLKSGRPSPGELRVQFFGVSTLLISDGHTSIMVDGFFSRPGVTALAFKPLEPDLPRIRSALALGDVNCLDAIIVAHSHHDHVMDTAAVALATNAIVFGSTSTEKVVRGGGLSANRVQVIRTREQKCIGKFTLTFIESPHSSDSPFHGKIRAPVGPKPRVEELKQGQNFSFFLQHPKGNILVVPSANSFPTTFDGVRASIVFLGIGGLGRQSDDFIEPSAMMVQHPRPNARMRTGVCRAQYIAIFAGKR
jgi:L-ascorbate metabolism protein UlaG (beta-lactamase superfamily)